MKKLLAVIAALLFALPAWADVVQARDADGTAVTILQTPCENKGVLAQLPELNGLLAEVGQLPRTAGDLYAGSVFYRGKEYGACWTPVGEAVVVVDDSGEQSSIFAVPAADFRSVRSI